MAAAGLAAAAAIGSGAAPAMAAPLSRAEICASRAVVYDTPGGIVVGAFARGTGVVVLKRSADRRWVRVRSARAITGWTRKGALCA